MNIRLCAVAAALLLASTYQGPPPAKAPTQAVVRGIVSDETGGRIAGADVHFTREGRKVVTQTWSDGTYDAKLPPGIYNVLVTGEGFCPGRRADFSARAGAEIHFDFTLLTCASDSYRIGVAGFEINRYGYDWEELPAPTGSGLRPLVLFGTREESDGVVRYLDLDLLGIHHPVIYSYDLFTIRTAALSFSTKDHSLSGTGHVVLEDGKTTKLGSKIEVAFRDGTPQIDLTE